jgi:hypothetical protein
MSMRLAKFLGQIVLFLASMALITGLSLFLVGSYLLTWPVLRLSPEERRTKALLQAGVALMGVLQAYKPKE